MPKRIKDKNKSIFVKFHEDVIDKKINKLLFSMNLTGTRVSTLINRWAIEIPFWKEHFYLEKFSDNDLVEVVHESFDRKRKILSDFEQEEIEDEQIN